MTTDERMPKYFEFEISLLDIQPRIWRRFRLTADSSFETLHNAIGVLISILANKVARRS